MILIAIFYAATWWACARFLYRRWRTPYRSLVCDRDHRRREYSPSPSYSSCCVKSARDGRPPDGAAALLAMMVGLAWPLVLLTISVRSDIKRPEFTKRKRREILTGKALARAERAAGVSPSTDLD